MKPVNKPFAALVAAMLALAGCQTPPANTTYDAIKNEVARDAARRPAAPAVDDAVANALLPPAASSEAPLPANCAADVPLPVSLEKQPASRANEALTIRAY